MWIECRDKDNGKPVHRFELPHPSLRKRKYHCHGKVYEPAGMQSADVMVYRWTGEQSLDAIRDDVAGPTTLSVRLSELALKVTALESALDELRARVTDAEFMRQQVWFRRAWRWMMRMLGRA